MTSTSLLLLFFSVLLLLTTTTNAKVPKSDTFKVVNEGEFGDYITEYHATYRGMSIFPYPPNYPLSELPFQLMWYNTTPGEYYVGLRMGIQRSDSLRRWLWDANRGKPVKENATLTFSTDGNLVLAEADGTVVWSTNTANKGVVGIKILPVGNIVLFDKSGKFVWQSFDHPTDTLLVGQSLYVGGPTKLVSRRSATDNSNGMYSFELEPKGLNLYVTVNGKKLLYSNDRFIRGGPIKFTNVTFDVDPSPPEEADAYELRLLINGGTDGSFTAARPKYNATLSFLRLPVDGNLEVYTYYDPVDYQAWERSFSFFSDNLLACDLPSKCGSLGVCEDEMCVACPTAKGLLGWSKTCSPPASTGKCKNNSSYYKVAGVEHFIPKFNKGIGKVKVEECRRRCNLDCKCLGFFYWEKEGNCWLAPVLGSLSSVSNTSHVVYIKN